MTGIVDDDRLVLRVVKRNRTQVFVPSGAVLPIPEEFRPSTEDEHEAAENGVPVRVSVWDWDITTVPQAIAFRTLKADEPSPLVVSLHVEAIRDVGRKHNNARVQVVYCQAGREGAGVEGHCGIEGCDRQGTSKEAQRAMKEFRADLCHLCDDVSAETDLRPRD